MKKRKLLGGVAAVGLALTSFGVFSPQAGATIHPLIEAGDCARGVPQNATGDILDPPGQTFPNSANGANDHAAIEAVTKGRTDFSSPALGGHKLNGVCGR